MRRARALGHVVACALAIGCGGAARESVVGPEYAAAPEPAEVAEGERRAIAIVPIVIAEAGSSEPTLVLDADGTVHHAPCPGRVQGDVIVGEREGSAASRSAGTAVRVTEDGEVLGPDGRARFRIEGPRLVRADGRAAILEGGTMRFPESEAIALRVEGAGDPGAVRTALALVAYLALCGE